MSDLGERRVSPKGTKTGRASFWVLPLSAFVPLYNSANPTEKLTATFSLGIQTLRLVTQ
jgi:hypothetical protein